MQAQKNLRFAGLIGIMNIYYGNEHSFQIP